MDQRMRDAIDDYKNAIFNHDHLEDIDSWIRINDKLKKEIDRYADDKVLHTWDALWSATSDDEKELINSLKKSIDSRKKTNKNECSDTIEKVAAIDNERIEILRAELDKSNERIKELENTSYYNRFAAAETRIRELELKLSEKENIEKYNKHTKELLKGVPKFIKLYVEKEVL